MGTSHDFRKYKSSLNTIKTQFCLLESNRREKWLSLNYFWVVTWKWTETLGGQQDCSAAAGNPLKVSELSFCKNNCIWRKGLENLTHGIHSQSGCVVPAWAPHPEKSFSTVCAYLFSAVKIFPTSSFSLTSFLLRAHWFNIVHFSLTPLFLRFFTCNTHIPATRVSNVYGVEEAEFIN